MGPRQCLEAGPATRCLAPPGPSAGTRGGAGRRCRHRSLSGGRNLPGTGGTSRLPSSPALGRPSCAAPSGTQGALYPRWVGHPTTPLTLRTGLPWPSPSCYGACTERDPNSAFRPRSCCGESSPRVPARPAARPANRCGSALPVPQTLTVPFRRAPRRGHRLTPSDDELYQRTHISLLQREAPHTMYIDSYSSRGFMVNGNRVFGPCALLPRSVLQWNVSPPLRRGSGGLELRLALRSSAVPLRNRPTWGKLREFVIFNFPPPLTGRIPPGHHGRKLLSLLDAGAPNRYWRREGLRSFEHRRQSHPTPA